MWKQENMLASPIVQLWLGCRGELHINAKLTEVFSHSPKEDGRCVTGGIKVKLENWDCSWLKVDWKLHRNISLTAGLGRRILKDSNWIQAFPLLGERMYMKLCRNRLGIIRMCAVICRTRSKNFWTDKNVCFEPGPGIYKTELIRTLHDWFLNRPQLWGAIFGNQ